MSGARALAAAGVISALISVAAGAFGAHGLRSRVSAELLGVFETAVRYQMYHALGLLACAWMMERWSLNQALLAGWLFVAGTVVFSGSLYLLVLTEQRWLGAVTPVGGLCFVAGWAVLAWGLLATIR